VGSAAVSEALERLLRDLATRAVDPELEAPAEVRPWLDDLLSRADTYRDASLIVLAYAVHVGSAADIATPPTGRRSVAQRLAGLLDELNVRARRDAFQTLAKGTSTLLGRKREAWNRLLEWGERQPSIEPVDQAMRYLATGIVATARDLPAIPTLDVSRLTFRRVLHIIEELFSRPSGGAHEQFLFAALLHALAEERGNRRVETKTLSAADASAGTAADVQIFEGGKVIEAYEVTANAWHSKVAQATAVMRHYDLRRVHIVAPGPAPSAKGLKDAVAATPLPAGTVIRDLDLSVLDLSHECRSLVHRLSRTGRRAALTKLWEHLASRQPNDELVRRYVDGIREARVAFDDQAES